MKQVEEHHPWFYKTISLISLELTKETRLAHQWTPKDPIVFTLLALDLQMCSTLPSYIYVGSRNLIQFFVSTRLAHYGLSYHLISSLKTSLWNLYVCNFNISSSSVITVCPSVPSVKKHEIAIRRECAWIFFLLLSMFIRLGINNEMLWTSWSMLIITVENQKSANYNNVHSCDFCFVLNTTLQMFISPKYWNYLFGYITFALFSYLCSFWVWYFHSFQVPWWSCWIFWKDLTKQLNSCFLRWPSSLLGSVISSVSLLDFYYILTMVLDVNFCFFF